MAMVEDMDIEPDLEVEEAETPKMGGDIPPAPVNAEALQPGEQLSALRDNLARKGKNSYYYAHTRVIDTPSWDGREAPRRLVTAADPPLARPPKRAEKVTNYAWANEKARVKIYVPMEGCGAIEERNISLKWEARCVDLEIEMPSGPRRLHIPSLHDEITGAHFRKKENKIIVTLKKKEEINWYDLTTAS